MKKRLAALVGASLLVNLGGCGEAVGPSFSLQESWQRWKMSDVGNYDYVLGFGNEWTSTTVWRVEVRNGTVHRVLDGGGHTIITLEGTTGPTIDSLFARAFIRLEDPSTQAVLRFHPILGYPTRIEIDAPQTADDAEWYFVNELNRR